jgi:hypothetical protein
MYPMCPNYTKAPTFSLTRSLSLSLSLSVPLSWYIEEVGTESLRGTVRRGGGGHFWQKEEEPRLRGILSILVWINYKQFITYRRSI